MQATRRRRRVRPWCARARPSGPVISRPRREPTSASSRCRGCLSRLRTGRVLEVGYAFAEPAYIAALVEADPGELVGADLADGGGARLRDGRRRRAVAAVPGPVVRPGSARLDARAHRRGQRGVRRRRASPTTRVARPHSASFAGSCAPSGSLLVTVPLGEPGDYGWFRQEDVRGWTRLFTGAGFFVEEQEAYELGGGRLAIGPDVRRRTGVVYGTRGPAASAVLCAELSPRRLRRLVSPDGVRRTARRRLGPSYRRLRGT